MRASWLDYPRIFGCGGSTEPSGISHCLPGDGLFAAGMQCQPSRWSSVQDRKRTVEIIGREDESEDKKVVVPPFNEDLQSPADHVAIQ